MKTDPTRRLPAAALAALAATTSIALGCSSAGDAIDDLVDDIIEDNVDLGDVTDSGDEITFVIPESSSTNPGSTVVLSFPGGNQVNALVTPADGGPSEVSTGTASIDSDSGNDRITATLVFEGGALNGQSLEVVVDYDTDSTGLIPDGDGTITGTLNNETTFTQSF